MRKYCCTSILPVNPCAGKLLSAFSFALLILPQMIPLAGCKAKAPLPADVPVAVRLRAPQQIVEPDSVAVSGAVEANVTADLGFQIAGRVSRVLVEEGQAVRKGQVLAELDAADYRNGYDASAGQAEAAHAQEMKAQAGPRSQELEQARIDLASWQDKYQRMKYLYEHKSLPEHDFKQIEDGYLAARQRYEMAHEGTRVEDRLAAVGQRRAAEAQMHEAAKHLEDCRLRAPINGLVGLRRIDAGVTVSSGTPVLSVLDLDPVKVRVAIPEAEVGKLKVGNRAEVRVPALGGRLFEGKLEALGVAADTATRSYVAKIVVANPAHVLRAGMVAEARIFSETKINMLTVPGEAVVRDARGVPQVYVFDASRQRVYARRVEVGALEHNEVEIRSGLGAKDEVVVAGEQQLHDGAPVKSAEGQL